MARVDFIRAEIREWVRSASFRPFILTLGSGASAVIEFPENIAFDPEFGGAEDFYVISGPSRLYSTLSEICTIGPADRDGMA